MIKDKRTRPQISTFEQSGFWSMRDRAQYSHSWIPLFFSPQKSRSLLTGHLEAAHSNVHSEFLFLRRTPNHSLTEPWWGAEFITHFKQGMILQNLPSFRKLSCPWRWGKAWIILHERDRKLVMLSLEKRLYPYVYVTKGTSQKAAKTQWCSMTGQMPKGTNWNTDNSN